MKTHTWLPSEVSFLLQELQRSKVWKVQFLHPQVSDAALQKRKTVPRAGPLKKEEAVIENH